MLFKGKGERAAPGNYRPVCLLRTLFKLYQSVIQARFEAFHRAHPESIVANQAGFRTHRSCSEQVVTLELIKNWCETARKPLLIASLDLEKAFDSAAPERIIKAMVDAGVPKELVMAAKVVTEP